MNDSYYYIRERLEDLHEVYSLFFDYMDIRFVENDKNMPTAAIIFNTEDGKPLNFVCNKKFWEDMDEEQRAFIVAHEMSHIIHKHGSRCRAIKEGGGSSNDLYTFNIAADIIINEFLFNDVFSYGIMHGVLETIVSFAKVKEQYGITDEELTSTKFHYSSDYLYKLLLEKQKDGDGYGNFLIMEIDEDSLDKTIDELDRIFDEISHSINDGSAREFLDKNDRLSDPGVKAGNGKGDIIKKIKNKIGGRSVEFEKIVRGIANKHKTIYDKLETWKYVDNRHYSISARSGTRLPARRLMVHEKKQVLDLIVYVDVSSSCDELFDPFFRAIKSIPKDKFNLRLFTFNTRVEEVPEDATKLRANGGTDFRAVKYHYNKLGTNGKVLTFIFTDGASDYKIDIDNRKQLWHAFVPNNYTDSYLPDKCKVHKLSNFI